MIMAAIAVAVMALAAFVVVDNSDNTVADAFKSTPVPAKIHDNAGLIDDNTDIDNLTRTQLLAIANATLSIWHKFGKASQPYQYYDYYLYSNYYSLP